MSDETSSIIRYSDQVVFSIIKDSWAHCGGRQRGYVNFEEATLGLQRALHHLQPVVPLPKPQWYRLAFDNFDRHQTGYITFDFFCQIIQQYHQYHVSTNLKKARKIEDEKTSLNEFGSEESSEISLCSGHTRCNSNQAGSDNCTPKQPYRGDIEFISSFVFPSHKGISQITKDYQIGKTCLGEGAFSRVFLARHRQTGQLRVCKVTDVTCYQQWELIQQEISLMRALNHPNILRLHEAYDGGYTIFLILELCSGGPLYSRILQMRNPLMEEQVADWMKQILSATAFCHERGIVHRDIKPENILFVNEKDDSYLKIIDFGLSSTLTKMRQTQREIYEKRKGLPAVLARILPKIQGKPLVSGMIKKTRMHCAGTPNYMAPEMIKGVYNEKCDMFSIGVILYQLLSGKHPFSGKNCHNQQMVKKNILYENPQTDQEEWQAVSPQAIHLVKWMLQKNPRKRCSAKEALNHIWFKIMEKPREAYKTQLTPSLFDGLKQWEQLSGFKRAIIRLLASGLSEEQIIDLRRKFQLFDRSGDGTITLDELRLSIHNANYDVPDDVVERIFRSLDVSRSNRIYYMEFISALLLKRNDIIKAQLRNIFNKFDVNGEGKITIDALRLTLRHTKYGTLSEDDLEAIFNDMDSNKDGYVDFYEFYQLLTT